MKQIIHHSKELNRAKIQRDIILLILLMVIVCVVGSWYARRRIISPVGDNPIIKVVYASEEVPEFEQIVSYITKKFAPEGKHVVVQALRIAYCESGIRSNALNTNTNGSQDFSVFQVNSIHTKRYGSKFKTSWKDNVDTAYKIFKAQGWGPWVCAGKLGI